MAEAVEVLNLDRVLKRFDGIRMALLKNQRFFARIGEHVQYIVAKRTVEEHRSPAGAHAKGSWDEYSEGHREFRRRYGAENLDKVDLTLTGGMFGALTFEATDDMVRIFFASTVGRPYVLKAEPGKKKRTVQQKATEAQKAFYLHQDRPFFLLADSEVKEIVRLYEKYVTKAIESGGR